MQTPTAHESSSGRVATCKKFRKGLGVGNTLIAINFGTTSSLLQTAEALCPKSTIFSFSYLPCTKVLGHFFPDVQVQGTDIDNKILSNLYFLLIFVSFLLRTRLICFLKIPCIRSEKSRSRRWNAVQSPLLVLK